MTQQTRSGFEKFATTTRRAQLLAAMERVLPWAELCSVVEAACPKRTPAGGWPQPPLERILRTYFL